MSKNKVKIHNKKDYKISNFKMKMKILIKFRETKMNKISIVK